MTERRINSVKRNAILDYLYNSDEHPSAEMILCGMKNLYPQLSLGTVYRNLNVLLEDGSIVRVCNVDGIDRFDAKTNSHPHFICRKCKRVIDYNFDMNNCNSLIDESRNSGLIAESIKMEIIGLCDKCSC